MATAITEKTPSIVKSIVAEQRNYFKTGDTKAVSFRIKQLKRLKQAILAYESKILDALYKDLRKCETEGYLTEVGFVLNDLEEAIAKTKRWAKPKQVATPLFHQKGSSYIHPEPLGVTLIVGPWNYPFQLLLAPLIGAIAAGNTCVLKPSEYSIHTSNTVAEMIAEYFEPGFLTVVEGGVESSKNLLAERFDYIFFTGSTQVGKIVYQAAAKHLTPVTLELGGKSPCIVDKYIHLEYAAKRIVFGKLINVGQTCIAPDYLLVHTDIKEKLVKEIKKQIVSFYGEDPSKSDDYGRIINEKHFDRLCKLLDENKIVFGGKTDRKNKYIAPTLMDDVTMDDAVMQEEIFGPILPIIEFTEIDDAIDMINAGSKPLALYCFSKRGSRVDKVVRNTSSGGVCINDTIMHIANPNLPFGGVGDSGIGAYHSESTFKTFSHQKSVMHKSFLVDVPMRYPPFGGSLKLLKPLLKYFNK